MMIDDDTAAILDALLPQIPFEGWTRTALRAALASIGQPPEDAALFFPGGSGEMIESFCALADARMEEAAEAADLAAYRIPGRVRAILAIRFEQNRGNKEAIRRALSWLSLPIHAPRAARITARTVDAVWHAAGDTSADFSWYTKRAILAGVYSSTLLFWLNDSSDDDDATLRFLDRRLANVGQITKLRKRLEARMPKFRPVSG
ncbi:MAG: ubiquinone biosynthesis protein [Rhodospirillales bacterium 20-64-7]|nr:MAG: ubiquinone biosynthesis protein [Rhodospirillales bacterium 20-64-7]